MILIKLKELLEKNKISRYKLERYTNLRYERINDYYYSRVKAVKIEELEELCKLFDCKVEDIIEYKKDK